MRQQSSDGLYNVITLVFVGLTLFVCLIVGLMLSGKVRPPVGFAPQTPTFPATKEIPTETATPTPTLTPLPSQTSIPTSTPRPSATATFTPTETFTPPPTETPLPTLPPTEPPTQAPTELVTQAPQSTPDVNQTQVATAAPTQAGFPFRVQEGSPALLSNLDATIGCSYQGIGGQVFGMNSEPMLNLQISVASASTTYPIQATGSNPRFGESGWMVQMDTTPSAQAYTVQVLSGTGQPLSDKVQITFPGTCDQNLALINFVQTRGF